MGLTAKEYQALRISKAVNQESPEKLLGRKKNKHDESLLQEAIIKYARLKYPDEIIYAIPNGAKRGIVQASIMKRTGLLAGVPDIFIAKPFSSPKGLIQFHGLYMEIKTSKGVLSENQKTIIPKLQEKGYQVEIIRSLDDAIKILNEYLG